MTFKNYLIALFVSLFFFSCTEDNDVTVPRNLQEYIDSSSTKDFGEVIACAASAEGSTSLSYVFYYPEEGATDIRYYEADSLDVDETDFSKYRRQILTVTDVFGGKLQRFERSNTEENWCLVTYKLNGELHKSNPIRLKNVNEPTTWTDEVTIEFPETVMPQFTWSDFGEDNEIYFEVISESEDETFLSGTYTNDTFFKYLDNTNVVLDINVDETPEDLVEDTEYLFTMMAVSEDNWVNTVIEETFIPRNLEEYLEVNATKTVEVATAFAASASGSSSLSYIYYYPLVGASDMRYYETVGTSVDETDFSEYRRKTLTDGAVLGAKFRRYSRTDTEECWSIITYVIGDILYKSNPIKINIDEKPTEWLTDENVTIDSSERLQPKFTWIDGTYDDSVRYLQVFTDSESSFLSGTFTTDKTFQYYDLSNTTSNINTETPPELIFDDEYNFTLMGLSSDNWVNLIIQQSFIAE
ncbi:hypothetical protein [Polaribacter sp. Hel1_85]|uniref:hypothetical protein n=1 Tax=Polaribacter sp. Hel1_85 TaxID=1250005 RepID=UPI00052DE903|nr:hypothetical protein [Polaribacter sp. Hel1_85]KGL58585.1 hypothetical protein PHEL85_2849 [Polaribacter sp. Hel1_85]